MRILTNKRKYIEQNFYSVAGVMPQRWDLGVLGGGGGGGGVKNFSVGICDGAPSLNGQLSSDRLKINQRSYYELPYSAF